MKGVKELKARLKSIGNIRKITSTMELVAAAKLRRLQERALASRPYATAITDLIAHVSKSVSVDSPLFATAEKIERECLVVIAADRGLCGAFNSNVFRKAMGYYKERMAEGVEIDVYTFGRRAEGFFSRVGAPMVGCCDQPVEKVDYRHAATTMQSLVDDFKSGRFQRVSLVYTWFKTAMTFEPKIVTVLPVEPVSADDESEDAGRELAQVEYIMEPSAEEILASLLPKALEMQLYTAILESLASEVAARRIAMKNATDAADDMTGELTLEFNKARQAGITGDLLDIVAGAEAQAG